MKEAGIRFFVPVDAKSTLQLYKTIDNANKDGFEKFNILIASKGGDVDIGISANMTLKHYITKRGINIDTYAVGNVDSIANLLFCSGFNRYSDKYSTFTIHDVFWNFAGSFTMYPEKMMEMAVGMEYKRNIIAELLNLVIKKGVDEIKEIMKKGIVLRVDEALEYNLVTKIKEPELSDYAEMFTIDEYIDEIPRIKIGNYSRIC